MNIHGVPLSQCNGICLYGNVAHILSVLNNISLVNMSLVYIFLLYTTHQVIGKGKLQLGKQKR